MPCIDLSARPKSPPEPSRCSVGFQPTRFRIRHLPSTSNSFKLSYWVRDRATLSLESAVWRLTGHPAEVYGLRDRGRIAIGYAADLVAFDPTGIGTTPPERVWDFPNATDRLVARGSGVHSVWVNGSPIRSGGIDLEAAAPGRRPGGGANDTWSVSR
jgi:N-acyl-D-aspartate/D-glutamate deacylase